MPLASLLHDRFLRLLAQGGERLDWAAIGGLAASGCRVEAVQRQRKPSSHFEVLHMLAIVRIALTPTLHVHRSRRC